MNVFYHPFTFISQVCSLKLCKLSYLPIVFSQLLLDANYFLQSISLAVLIYWYSESATEHAALIIVFYCWCNHFFHIENPELFACLSWNTSLQCHVFILLNLDLVLLTFLCSSIPYLLTLPVLKVQVFL